MNIWPSGCEKKLHRSLLHLWIMKRNFTRNLWLNWSVSIAQYLSIGLITDEGRKFVPLIVPYIDRSEHFKSTYLVLHNNRAPNWKRNEKCSAEPEHIKRTNTVLHKKTITFARNDNGTRRNIWWFLILSLQWLWCCARKKSSTILAKQ